MRRKETRHRSEIAVIRSAVQKVVSEVLLIHVMYQTSTTNRFERGNVVLLACSSEIFSNLEVLTMCARRKRHAACFISLSQACFMQY